MEMVDISVIIPICEPPGDLEKLYSLYSQEIRKSGKSWEFVFIIDGGFEEVYDALRELKKNDHDDIKIIKFSKAFGESTALMVGFEKSRGKILLTLLPYMEVEPAEVHKVLQELGMGADLVVTNRYPRIDSLFNRFQSLVFNWLVSKLTDQEFHDISCGLRGMERKVAEEISIYGDLHHFIPVIASREGFKTREINVRQSEENVNLRLHRPGRYLSRILDLFNLFFLVKFTKRPFRFFGLIGSALLGLGSLITLYLGLMRIFAQAALAGRPLLILGILLMVFGIQTLSIGLIGEIIIFIHARDIKDYKIEHILE